MRNKSRYQCLKGYFLVSQYLANAEVRRYGLCFLKENKNMYELQEKAINAARTVLFNEFSYNANELALMDMYVVWFSKTLQNWKALVSGVHIKEYIEVTYNGDRKETYVDVYQKACNRCLKDGGDEDCQ